MAEEYSLDKALVLIRDDNGSDINAEVTSVAGWIDISVEARGSVVLDFSAANQRLTPTGDRAMGRMIAGDGSGTITINKILDKLAADAGARLLERKNLSRNKRFQVCIQPFRDPLTNNAGVVTPAASATNPQWVGSVMMQRHNVWGPGGQQTAIAQTVGDLDSDWQLYDS